MCVLCVCSGFGHRGKPVTSFLQNLPLTRVRTTPDCRTHPFRINFIDSHPFYTSFLEVEGIREFLRPGCPLHHGFCPKTHFLREVSLKSEKRPPFRLFLV